MQGGDEDTAACCHDLVIHGRGATIGPRGTQYFSFCDLPFWMDGGLRRVGALVLGVPVPA